MTIDTRHRRTILVSLATLIFAGGCGGGGMGSGKMVTKEPTLSGSFSKIDLRIPAELRVHKGAKPSMKIEVDEDLASSLSTDTIGNQLTIASSKPITSVNKCVIDVTCPAIDAITVEGAAAVHVDDITAPNFDIQLSGASDLEGSGSTDTVSAKISGAGKVNLGSLKSKNASVTINGAGDCVVNATDSLSVMINGAGSVKYKGSPAKINKQLNGAGTLGPL
jgi:hypothetical protein